MLNQHKKTNAVLKYLYDSIDGIKECAKNTKSDPLRLKLLNIAQKRETFADEVKRSLFLLGVKPENSGTSEGALHRMYIDLKGIISQGNSEAIKQEFKRGDQTLIETYRETIHSEDIHPMKHMLKKQLMEIEEDQLDIDI